VWSSTSTSLTLTSSEPLAPAGAAACPAGRRRSARAPGRPGLRVGSTIHNAVMVVDGKWIQELRETVLCSGLLHGLVCDVFWSVTSDSLRSNCLWRPRHVLRYFHRFRNKVHWGTVTVSHEGVDCRSI
jgi:hypothetical protein